MATTMNDVSQDAKEQIAQLRAQVQTLMSERVAPALSTAADTAQKYVDQARDVYEENTEALSEQVRESPLLAILIATGVGFLIGRIVR
jgi:ElaB/YqjD/DUF883 family membrane-anchored ribosome-binding protein